eukprot:348586-Rhodomonas_salina.9
MGVCAFVYGVHVYMTEQERAPPAPPSSNSSPGTVAATRRTRQHCTPHHDGETRRKNAEACA